MSIDVLRISKIPLKELERAWELDKQEWAKDIRDLLLQINKAVDDAGGQLSAKDSIIYRQQYWNLLEKAETECPPPDDSQRKGKKGRLKRSKSRNLLERLRDFENETLLFMDDEYIKKKIKKPLQLRLI